MADDLMSGMMDEEDVTSGVSGLYPNWLEIGRKLMAGDDGAGERQGMRPRKIGESYEDWSREWRIRQGRAAAFIMQNVKDDPDKIAAVYNTAKAFSALSGIYPPFEMAKQFHKEFEDEIDRRKNEKILNETPLLSLAMRNPEFVALARDDLKNLSWFAGLGNTIKVGVSRGAEIYSGVAFEGGVGLASGEEVLDPFEAYLLQGIKMEREGAGFWDILTRSTPEGEELKQLSEEWGREQALKWGANVDFYSKARERYPKSGIATAFEEKAMSGSGDDPWETLGNWGGAFLTNPAGGLSWILETVGENWPQLALQVTAGRIGLKKGGRWGAIGAGSATSGGLSYITERWIEPAKFFHKKGYNLSKPEHVEKIINNPKLMREAAERGHIRGMIIGALDALSVGIAGKAIGKNPYFDAIAQGVTQMILGGAGEGLASVAVGDKWDWNEVYAEAFAELGMTPIDMASAGRKMGEMRRARDAAAAFKGWLSEISQMAQASKLRGRAPDKFGEFVGAALKGTPGEALYVDAGKLNEYFQSKGVDPNDAIKAIDGVGVGDFARALETGGDIIIPTSSYAASIAGTDLDVWLEDNARLDPAGLSESQAADYDARADDLFAELAEEEALARRAREAEASVEEQIHQEMTARLELAGRVPAVAQAEAASIAAFYRTMSERAGISMEEMLARYPLPEVRGDLPVEMVGDARLDQSGRDTGGRAAPATINIDAVLEPVELENLPPIDGYKNAQGAVEKGTFENQSGDKVLISSKAIKKWFHGKENAIKRALAPHFHKIFERSVTYHKGEDGFSYAAGLINLDGKQVGVRFAIKEVGDKDKDSKLYQVEGIEIETIGGESLPPIEQAAFGDKTGTVLQRGGDTHELSIAQIVEAFNRHGAKNSPLFQGGENEGRGNENDGARGSIAFGQDGATIINLFRDADLSTFLHETGHFFLTILQDMAARGEVNAVAELEAVKNWWRGNAGEVAKDANKADSAAGVEVADVTSWLDNGTSGNAAKDAAINIGTQEQFARGFEAYLMEGKAPSQGLRAAFETFRGWLVAIYKRLTSLNVKINDEIRGVFDRMIASDEAIAAMGKDVDGVAPSVMADAASLGLTDKEYADLLKLRGQAQDEAQARMLEKTMQPLRRAREKWFKAERAKVKEQVTEGVNARPHYRVFEWLGNRRWFGDDSPDAGMDLRLDKAQLVERYGEDILKRLPRGQFTLYSAKGGADIDMVAGLFGFKSGDEMVQALEQMPKRKDAIEAETDKVMRERHGDVLNDGTVEMQANEAVHNDKKGQWLAAELKAIVQVAGGGVELSAKAAREYAAKQIAAMPVANAIKSFVFLAAERRAAREATRLAGLLAKHDLWQKAARERLADKARSAVADGVEAIEAALEGAIDVVGDVASDVADGAIDVVGDVAEAAGITLEDVGDVASDVVGEINAQIDETNAAIEKYNEILSAFIKAKQSQLLNHALYSESIKAAAEFEGLLRRAERLNKAINKIRSSRKRLGDVPIAGDYVEPIEAILENYGLRRFTGRALDKRAVLQAFIGKMEEEGRVNELGIDDRVLEDGSHLDHENLSVEHLRGVIDSLKNIEHMARMKGKLLMENKARDFAEAKQVIIDGLEKNLKQIDLAWIKGQSFIERIKKGMRSYLAVVQNATHILRRIDGREDLGAVYELLKTPLDTASTNERMLRAKAGEDFKKLYSVYSVEEQRQMGVERQYEELGQRKFSKWNLIAMALNMGNDGNLSRLTNKQAKQHLSDEEVNAVKRLLSKKDWDFVQSVWDYMETWKGKIAERDRRLRGIEPTWVEAFPVATPYGTYRGGYYPIKYDAELGGSRRMVDEANDVFSEMTAGSYAQATTRQGHLKARIGNGKQSLNLDISVMGKHVMEVIHDLEFNEPIVNAWRLLNNNEVEAAFLKANMKEAYDALKLWVQDVAAGQVMSDSDGVRLLNKLRGGFTISKLSFNAFTIVQQPLGLGQAAEMVGGKNLSAVMLEYARNASAMAEEVLSKSKMMWERRDTFNKDVMDALAQSNIANPKAGRIKDAIDDYVVPYGLLGLVAVQYYTVDVPTWIAAYRKGLSQFDGDEAKAVRYADMAISASQASGLFLDRSAIERGTLSNSIRQNPFVLLMTTLGSYFFSKQNRIIEATQELRSKPLTPQSIMEYAYSLSLLLFFEAALVQTIKWAMKDADDDDDDDSLAGNIASAGLENYLNGMPFVRDMVGAISGYDTGTYAAIINTLVKPFVRAADGKIDKPFAKSTINLIGAMTRLPSTQTNRVLDAVVKGMEEDEFSLMEAIFGRVR